MGLIFYLISEQDLNIPLFSIFLFIKKCVCAGEGWGGGVGLEGVYNFRRETQSPALKSSVSGLQLSTVYSYKF